MPSLLFLLALPFGAVLADRLGPMWWRLYWIAVGIFILRDAVVMWRRLRLTRMAAGLCVGACALAAIAWLGNDGRRSLE